MMKRAIVQSFILVFMVCIFSGCEKAEESSVAQSSTSIPISSSVAPEPEPIYESPIDFFELVNQNIDICAWITIDGTNIDYPVTRTDDNAFYLKHDAYGNAYAGGALFIDMSNNPDFTSPLTLMYGHYMPDGTIFTQLHLYKDEAFFKENNIIKVYLPNNCFTYEIIAAFPHGTENFLYNRDFTRQEEMQWLFDYINSKEVEQPDETVLNMDTVTTQDQILMLSTCDNNGGSRYLVAAKLIEKAKTE